MLLVVEEGVWRAMKEVGVRNSSKFKIARKLVKIHPGILGLHVGV